jgi:hypothetical protein
LGAALPADEKSVREKLDADRSGVASPMTPDAASASAAVSRLFSSEGFSLPRFDERRLRVGGLPPGRGGGVAESDGMGGTTSDAEDVSPALSDESADSVKGGGSGRAGGSFDALLSFAM